MSRPTGRVRLVGAVLILLGCGACASAGRRGFSAPTPDVASEALRSWETAVAKGRAAENENVNLLYDAAMSQGVVRSSGTLAIRIRGNRVEGTLAGAFGVPIATYADGELRGEKIRPVALPSVQLRALLGGVWVSDAPAVVGEDQARVLLRWTGQNAAEGVFDVGASELLSLRVERSEGSLEARFSGTRQPWPEQIEIREKKSGSRLSLKLLSRENAS